MIRAVVFCLFLPMFSLCQSWTIDQCIDSAIQNNITLKKNVLSTQIANVTLKNSKQSRLPSINANGVHGYNWGQTIDPFTNQFASNQVQYDNFYLISSMVLFSGLQNYYTIQANNYGVQQNQLVSEIAERNLKIDVSATFLQILLNESILKLSANNLEKTTQQFNRINELKLSNQATQFDVSEIEAQMSLDQYQVTKAKNDLKYSKLLLQQIINTSIKDNFEITSDFEKMNTSPNSKLKDSTVSTLPDILVIELDIEKQIMLLKSTKGRFYPSLLLSGSLGSGYSGNNKTLQADGSLYPKPFGRQLNENFYQSTQLTLSIPIFNKNNVRNQVKIAEYELQSLRLDKENEYNKLKQKLEQLSLDILNEKEQYNALQKVHESALLNYQNFTIRYQNGDVSFTELTEIQNKLFIAESKLIQSEYQLKFKSTLIGFYFSQ